MKGGIQKESNRLGGKKKAGVKHSCLAASLEYRKLEGKEQNDKRMRENQAKANREGLNRAGGDTESNCVSKRVVTTVVRVSGARIKEGGKRSKI